MRGGQLCRGQNRSTDLRSRCLSHSQPGEGEDGDVVVLAEEDCGFGGLLCIWPSSDQRSQTLEAEEFAGCVARFQQSVGIKSEPVAYGEAQEDFLVLRA